MAKLKCWKKLKDGWKSRDGKILQVKKVSFSWEKPNHNVIIHDSNEKSLESSLGKVIKVKHLGKKSEALEFAKEYMENNNRC
jgi:adenylylsulfate kinase-like enzyme